MFILRPQRTSSCASNSSNTCLERRCTLRICPTVSISCANDLALPRHSGTVALIPIRTVSRDVGLPQHLTLVLRHHLQYYLRTYPQSLCTGSLTSLDSKVEPACVNNAKGSASSTAQRNYITRLTYKHISRFFARCCHDRHWIPQRRRRVSSYSI